MEKKQAFNPYLPSYEDVPDGEPHVVDGRVYIYGSHDLFNGLNFCLGDYVCWSAPVDDLGSWRYEGCIYRREQDPAYQWSGCAGHDTGGRRTVLSLLLYGRNKNDLRGGLRQTCGEI